MRRIAAVAALMLLAGCSPTDDATPSPSLGAETTSAVPSPSPSPSPSPTAVESFPSAPASEDADSAALRRAWQEYEGVLDSYYRDPTLTDWDLLYTVTTGTETSRAVGAITSTREQNLKQTGSLVFTMTDISTISVNDGGDRTGTVTYCADLSRLGMIDTATSEVQESKHRTLRGEVSMVQSPDGSWRAESYTSEFDKC